jgi:hypothetical protein
MPTIHETAYPRFKTTVTAKDLQEVYTPTADELAFVAHHARTPTARMGLLVQLKTFQRLGYFPLLTDVPPRILDHLATSLGCSSPPAVLATYDASGTRRRHRAIVRARLGVTAYGAAARKALSKAAVDAARTKENVADIINVAIEDLVRQRYELPAFSTLVRVAYTARHMVNRGYQQRIAAQLTEAAKARLDVLFVRASATPRSLWDTVKREPKRPTRKTMTDTLAHLHWLKEQDVKEVVFSEIPAAKLKQFAVDAKALDAAMMSALRPEKRYAFAVTLIRVQVAKVLDDLTEMFIRRVQKLHHKGQEALQYYREHQSDQIDMLIALLRDILMIYLGDGSKEARFDSMALLFGADRLCCMNTRKPNLFKDLAFLVIFRKCLKTQAF